MQGLSLVASSGDHCSLRCAGLSLSRPLLLRSTGSRRAGSVVLAHGPRCSAACGIFLDQGSNPCPLHWQADSQPLHHQGSPTAFFKSLILTDLRGTRGEGTQAWCILRSGDRSSPSAAWKMGSDTCPHWAGSISRGISVLLSWGGCCVSRSRVLAGPITEGGMLPQHLRSG